MEVKLVRIGIEAARKLWNLKSGAVPKEKINQIYQEILGLNH